MVVGRGRERYIHTERLGGGCRKWGERGGEEKRKEIGEEQ